jgi:hypothetical protein
MEYILDFSSDPKMASGWDAEAKYLQDNPMPEKSSEEILDMEIRRTEFRFNVDTDRAFYEADKRKKRWYVLHPDWRIKDNVYTVMTGEIVKATPEIAGKLWLLFAGALGTAKPPAAPTAAPPPQLNPGSVTPSTLIGTGTRAQFRAAVLQRIRANPNHPLRFLLDQNGDFKGLSSRAHANLIENPDVWEAGHITSNKLGGQRLMVQSAWENQFQNVTVETKTGFGVTANPALDIGGIAVARSTAMWWESLGWLPAGTVARAPLVQ